MADKDVTPKTEEQIRAELKEEYEKVADKRVTEALKKIDKRWIERINKEKQANELETSAKEAEYSKADNAREIDIISKGLKLAVVDALQSLGMAPSLRNMIIVDDLVKLPDEKRMKILTDRVVFLYKYFTSEVNKQINEAKKQYLKGITPITSTGAPVSRYNSYKKAGDVLGMLRESFNEYYEGLDE